MPSGAVISASDGLPIDVAELLALDARELVALLVEDGVLVAVTEEIDDWAVLETLLLDVLLLTSGLLITALLDWLEPSSAGAPPQADNNIGVATKNASPISFFTHVYIDKHLKFKLWRP